MTRSRHFGWRPSLPDQRDELLKLAPLAAPLPPYVDLRSALPAVYDQGNLGSCTANALAAAFQFDQWKDKESVFMPSRLFVYYNARMLENSVASDAGASLRDGLKTLVRYGVCDETIWPYDIGQFAVVPPTKAYMFAIGNQVVSYLSVPQDLDSLRGCLVTRFPFVFGFTVYESFMTDRTAATGQVPMPGPNERSVGGHAVLCVGFNQARRCFWCRNSWGPSWGLNGYFWMPHEYLLDPNLSDDFWTVRSIQESLGIQ
jgi:C1A family cysteine protease